ncbi:ATP-binding protein [Lentzea sp. NPDC060358]|uniref:ATP-binding protein n=1 Tax=Lentzea sp. NPDC060358 TaxID=3347103 RepID=UPI003651C3CB
MSPGLPEDSPPLVHIRRWLRATFRGCRDDLLDDILLVCTELVSNAYDHACGPRDVRVARDAGGRVIRVEVDDASPRVLPTPGVSSIGSFRGRGMTLVNALASDWGVRTGGERKTVWAEFAVGADA